MTNKLRLIAASMVIESSMKNSEKRETINFLKEATDSQIKVFIMDRKISKLDEQAEEIVKDRFNVYIKEVDAANVLAGIAVSVFVAATLKVAYDALRLTWSKAHRTCLRYKGNEKQKCLLMYKKQSLEKMITILSSKKSGCKTTKDPKKCIIELDKKISTVKTKVDKIIIPS